MSVGRFQHMSDIYVTYQLTEKLMGAFAYCAKVPSSSLHIRPQQSYH